MTAAHGHEGPAAGRGVDPELDASSAGRPENEDTAGERTVTVPIDYTKPHHRDHVGAASVGIDYYRPERHRGDGIPRHPAVATVDPVGASRGPEPSRESPGNGPASATGPDPTGETTVMRRWRVARERGDVRRLVDLALAYDRESAPHWMVEEVGPLCLELADDIQSHLNREDDSDCGIHLIKLSSVLSIELSCMFALLGLAYHCHQPCEQNVSINEKIAPLLESQLEIFDLLMPQQEWPDFVHAWRELAVRRVEILVRSDLQRRIDGFKDAYAEAVRTAALIRVHEPAEEYLRMVAWGVKFFDRALRELEDYLPIIEDREERAHLIKFLEAVGHLRAAGRQVLDMGRR